MASLFSLHNTIDKNMLIDPNYVDGLRNLQVRFISEKNSNILDIFNLEMVSNNEKAKDIHVDISCLFCGKFGHWEYNCKNNFASLKQDISIAPKGVYMIQIYFSLSASSFDTWILDIICGSYIYNWLQWLQDIRELKKDNLELLNIVESPLA